MRLSMSFVVLAAVISWGCGSGTKADCEVGRFNRQFDQFVVTYCPDDDFAMECEKPYPLPSIVASSPSAGWGDSPSSIPSPSRKRRSRSAAA